MIPQPSEPGRGGGQEIGDAASHMLPAQLRDNATCVSFGLDDAALLAARDAIPLPSSYSTANETLFLPIFSSRVVAPSHAVVWIHGLSGDANTYYCSGVAATLAVGASAKTLSIAPWFGNKQVTLDEWLGATAAADWRWQHRLSRTAASRSAFWSTSRWLKGGDNSPSPARYTTSFDALDEVVRAISANPALEQAVELTSLVGFSAGAQLVSRWAFFSEEAATTRHVRTIVSDPSSYLYLDARRPAASCSPLEDSGLSHRCGSFETPSALSAEGSTSCPTFDDYKYVLAPLLTLSNPPPAVHAQVHAHARV